MLKFIPQVFLNSCHVPGAGLVLEITHQTPLVNSFFIVNTCSSSLKKKIPLPNISEGMWMPRSKVYVNFNLCFLVDIVT